MVSTVSEDFYKNQLSNEPLLPLANILEVEGADGHTLPYIGYVEVKVTVPETEDSLSALLLVVPSTNYHQQTPVLLGTNVIRHCLAKIDSSRTILQTGWEVANRCIKACDHQLRRQGGEVGVVKSDTSKTIALQSNQTLTLTGTVKRVYCQQQSVMFTATDKSNLPAGVEITPAVIDLGRQRNSSVNVAVSNLTSQTVVIPASATLCALQDVQRLGSEDLDQNIFKQVQYREDVATDFRNTEKNLTTDQFNQVIRCRKNGTRYFPRMTLT